MMVVVWRVIPVMVVTVLISVVTVVAVCVASSRQQPAILDPLRVLGLQGVQGGPNGFDGPSAPVVRGVVCGLAGGGSGALSHRPLSPPAPLFAEGKEDEDYAQDEENDCQEDAGDDAYLLSECAVYGQYQLVNFEQDCCGGLVHHGSPVSIKLEGEIKRDGH